MKIAFVYPDLQIGVPDWKGYYYCGVGSLAAQVKAAGHSTTLLHITDPDYCRDDFLPEIDAFGPDIVAFSATTLGFPWVARACQWLHEEGIRVHTICGGAHPSVAPELAVQTPHLDSICLGEGEGLLLELIEALEKERPFHELQNLWTIHEGEVIRNPLRPLIDDLDTLAPYDRTDWKNLPLLLEERDGNAITIASRGCPFKCTYCVNHYYMSIFPDKQFVRFRSVDNVIAELESIVETYDYIRGFVFDDDILYMRKSWSIEFTEKYEKRLGLPFVSNIRPNICKPEIVELLKRANCSTVKVGLESGNDHIRNMVLLRALDADDMVTAFHRLEKAGIKTISFNMVGLPEETPEAVLETVKLNVRAHVTDAQVSIYYPFPGTESAKACEEKGWVRPFTGDIYDYFSDSCLTMEALSREQILAYRESFKFFLRSYRAIDDHLHGWAGRTAEGTLDRVFLAPHFPWISRNVIAPARWAYRTFGRPLRWKMRELRTKIHLGAAPVAGHLERRRY